MKQVHRRHLVQKARCVCHELFLGNFVAKLTLRTDRLKLLLKGIHDLVKREAVEMLFKNHPRKRADTVQFADSIFQNREQYAAIFMLSHSLGVWASSNNR